MFKWLQRILGSEKKHEQVMETKSREQNKSNESLDDFLDRESFFGGTIRDRFEGMHQQTSHPYIVKHFELNQLIQDCYKERNLPGKLDECIQYCKEDIKNFPDFKKIWMETDGMLPRTPSFARLAIIYEKQKKYSEAAEGVRLASGYGLEDDGTKGGFTHRLERLEQKIFKYEK